MREFRPPTRYSTVRTLIAVLLPLIVLVPLGGLGRTLLGSSRASYTLADGALVVLVLLPLLFALALLSSAVLLVGPSRMLYRVGDGAIEVRTILGRKRWPTAGARAKAYRPSRLWRVAGVGAPGYRTGLFREAGQSTRVYVTETDTVLLFEGEDRVMVSPEDRVAMLRALEEEGVTIERHAA